MHTWAGRTFSQAADQKAWGPSARRTLWTGVPHGHDDLLVWKKYAIFDDFSRL